MQNTVENENAMLVNWSYTADEWRRFQRWKNRRNNIWHYLSGIFNVRSKKIIHTISVTECEVQLDGVKTPFTGQQLVLRRICIAEANDMNVMEISYQHEQHGAGAIRFPIPRGRLKEAIALEERLRNPVIDLRDLQQ